MISCIASDPANRSHYRQALDLDDTVKSDRFLRYLLNTGQMQNFGRWALGRTEADSGSEFLNHHGPGKLLRGLCSRFRTPDLSRRTKHESPRMPGTKGKRVLGIIAGILVARHLKTTEDLSETTRPTPRTENLVASAVQWAVRIMRKIDGVFSGKS
jgi:hypothetical protein